MSDVPDYSSADVPELLAYVAGNMMDYLVAMSKRHMWTCQEGLGDRKCMTLAVIYWKRSAVNELLT